MLYNSVTRLLVCSLWPDNIQNHYGDQDGGGKLRYPRKEIEDMTIINKLKLKVQHASRNFRNPHWTFEYEMVKINRTFLEMRHGYNNHDDTL